jgi:hypothetical protein
MQLIDNRVAIPSQVIAINHAVGLRAANCGFCRRLPDICIPIGSRFLNEETRNRTNFRLTGGYETQPAMSIALHLAGPTLGKTLKYQPQFPKWFGCIEDAKAFRRSFFA